MKGPIPIKVEWLYKFGEAIRNDMYCIIDDIEALWQHISSLRIITGRKRILTLNGLF